jgi:hypothetical protein
MSIETQLNLCGKQYGQWKALALKAKDVAEVKKCLGKALFWMELQSAFMALWSMEQIHGKNPQFGNKLIIARANLSKRLADYAKETLEDIK